MANIRDVAKHAGVSPATVSRILRGDPNFSTKHETREKVWQAINELGYIPVPSRIEDGADSKRALNIGTILNITVEKSSDPTFLTILRGIETQLRRYDTHITAFRVADEIENMLQDISSMQFDGFILMHGLSRRHLAQLGQTADHIVAIDACHSYCDSISYDHYQIGKTAAEHFLSLGHRDFAYFYGYYEADGDIDMAQEQTLAAFRHTVISAGGTLRPENVCAIPKWQQSVCYEQTLRILRGDRPPSAMFCASDLLAITASGAASSTGRSIPEDIALMGVTNIESTAYNTPPLTTISLPLLEIGQAAADLLMSRINGKEGPCQRILLPTELVARKSTTGI